MFLLLQISLKKYLQYNQSYASIFFPLQKLLDVYDYCAPTFYSTIFFVSLCILYNLVICVCGNHLLCLLSSSRLWLIAIHQFGLLIVYILHTVTCFLVPWLILMITGLIIAIRTWGDNIWCPRTLYVFFATKSVSVMHRYMSNQLNVLTVIC